MGGSGSTAASGVPSGSWPSASERDHELGELPAIPSRLPASLTGLSIFPVVAADPCRLSAASKPQPTHCKYALFVDECRYVGLPGGRATLTRWSRSPCSPCSHFSSLRLPTHIHTHSVSNCY